jgi:hypothetical protein
LQRLAPYLATNLPGLGVKQGKGTGFRRRAAVLNLKGVKRNQQVLLRYIICLMPASRVAFKSIIALEIPLASTRIYFAPFHATSGGSSKSPCGSTIATFKVAVSRQEWPYDNGDDPSFYATRTSGGQLTWGVCRQDVRNHLRPEDMVVFFSFRRFEETGDSEYRLCAVATVEDRVRQTELYECKHLRCYTKYFNLLIRPSKSSNGVWEHFEPALEGSRIHGDWLWRIADHDGLEKDDFTKLEGTDRFARGAAIRRRPVEIARNYIIFSSYKSKTYVLAKPPVIAWHSKGKPAEEWNADKFSQAVRRITLETAAQANGRCRSLRIRNSQRAHRHIVFQMPPSDAIEWRAEFLGLIQGH